MDQIASQIIHAKSDMFIIRNTNNYYAYLKLSISPILKYTKNLRL